MEDTSKTFIESNGLMMQELKNSTMINSQAIQEVKNNHGQHPSNCKDGEPDWPNSKSFG
jgi:hypothetical protein